MALGEGAGMRGKLGTMVDVVDRMLGAERVEAAARYVGSVRSTAYRMHWDARSVLHPFDLRAGLRLLDESERWPAERLRVFRDEKLRSLVAHAHARIPGYRRLMDEHGVRPEQIRGLADLPRLPILTKALLRERAPELTVPGIAPRDLEMTITGGTTGVPMRVVRDVEGTTWLRASLWRGLSWGGLSLGHPWAQLFGGSLGYGKSRRWNGLKNWFAGKLFLPAFELCEENVEAYVTAIRRAGARHLVGYASACYQLATLVERAGLRLSLDAVFPTAELLPEGWADTMRRVFGAKVLPYYGCGEVLSLGYSCPEAPGVYHTCDEHAVIEIEGRDGTARLDGEGSFLVTDLDNRAMPLIRYRNGDAGVVAPAGCACGRSLGRILRLDGRVNDVLVTTSGATISGAIGAHAFRLVPGVDAYQIVQRRPGEATLKIVRTGAYDPCTEEPKLRDIFGKHLGAGAEISIEYHAVLPKTAAGKARFVINEYLSPPPARAEAA